jgi:predicted nucleic acid-binding protein
MIPPRYLLDTNICIYIRRQQPREVLARFQKLRPRAAVISVITYGELLFGAEKSQSCGGLAAFGGTDRLFAGPFSATRETLTDPLEPICKRAERRSAIMISGLRHTPRQRRSPWSRTTRRNSGALPALRCRTGPNPIRLKPSASGMRASPEGLQCFAGTDFYVLVNGGLHRTAKRALP